jgi:GNAT superfamily N-acetyltransferase
MAVSYQLEPDLSIEAFIDVMERSGLAERRPLKDPCRVRRMLKNSDLILTARDNDMNLIGVSRCVTDFALCCYCSDLAVDRDWQGQGVGKELLHRSRAAAGEECLFHLLSSPSAMDYYPHVGLEKFDMCFGIRRTPQPKSEKSA